jgi:hypothetical protein
MSSGGGDTTTTTKAKPWSGIQPYLTSGYGQFDQSAQNIAPYYPNQTYAGFTQPQQQGQQSIMNYANSMQPSIDNGLAASNFQLTAVQDPNSNQYLKSYVDSAIRPVTEQYQNQVLPGIRDQAEMYGGAGSRTGLAEGLAAQGYQNSIGDITSSIYSNAYGQGLNAQSSALGQLPQTLQTGSMPGQYMNQVGTDQMNMNQLGINEAMNRYTYGYDAPYNRYKDYLSTLQGTPWGTSSTTGADPNASNPWASAIGGGLSGAGMGYQMGGGYGALAGGIIGAGGGYLSSK